MSVHVLVPFSLLRIRRVAVSVQLLSRVLYLREVISGPQHVETLHSMATTASALSHLRAFPLSSALFRTVRATSRYLPPCL